MNFIKTTLLNKRLKERVKEIKREIENKKNKGRCWESEYYNI